MANGAHKTDAWQKYLQYALDVLANAQHEHTQRTRMLVEFNICIIGNA